MSTLGTVAFKRKDNSEVVVGFEKSAGYDSNRSPVTIYGAKDSNKNPLARISLSARQSILSFSNQSDEDPVTKEKNVSKKIDGLGKPLMGCVIAECYRSKSLSVEASGSHWVYIRFGFEPSLGGAKQSFERFPGLVSICEMLFKTKTQLSTEAAKQLQDYYFTKRDVRAKELDKSPESLSWQDVCWAHYSEMRGIFERAQKKGERPDDLGDTSIMMELGERGFDQWTAHIITSPLIKDSGLVAKLQEKVVNELETVPFPETAQNVILGYLEDKTSNS